jgi:DNA-binding CsgD family transcriptional regulator/PAS domain-containing protein
MTTKIYPRKSATRSDPIDGLVSFAESICPAAGFQEDVTLSGSFDVTPFGSDSNLFKFLQILPIGCFLIGTDLRICFANHAAVKSVEDAHAFLGREFRSLFPDKRIAKRIENVLLMVLSFRESWIAETELRIGNDWIWGKCFLLPIRLPSERSILCLVEDLTAENRELRITQTYAQLMKIFPWGIGEFRPDHCFSVKSSGKKALEALQKARLVDGNPSLASMLGYESLTMIVGRTLSDVFSLQEAELDHLSKWAKKGFSVISFEKSLSSPTDDTIYHEHTLIGNIIDHNLSSFWGVVRDTSHIRKERDLLINQNVRMEDYSERLKTVVRDRTKDIKEFRKRVEENARKLEEANYALKFLISGVTDQKESAKKEVLNNLKSKIVPIIDQLLAEKLSERVQLLVSTLAKSVSDLTDDGRPELPQAPILTLKEIRICEMIMSGLSSKEIAVVLGVSTETVFFHRSNIRKKLGLIGQNTDLGAFMRHLKLSG